VSLVTLKDGSRAVRKVPWGPNRRTAARGYDAEELAGEVARTLGLDAPETHRASERELWQSYVEEDVAQIADTRTTAADWEQRWMDPFVSSADGARLGLLDLLVFNGDRHNSNWLVTPSDRIIPIDHGAAWGGFIGDADRPQKPDDAFQRLYTMSLWDEGIELDHDDDEGYRWVSNPLSRASAMRIRDRLAALRPRFEAMGRTDWHDAMMARMKAIVQNAQGTMEL
jgi:hypothetical protein